MASTHVDHNLGLSNDYTLESAMEGVPNPIPVPITQAYSGSNSVLTGLESPLQHQKSPMQHNTQQSPSLSAESLTNLSDSTQSHTITQMHSAPRSPYAQTSNLNSVHQGYVCDTGYPNQSSYQSPMGQPNHSGPIYHQMGVSGNETESPNHNLPPMRNNDYGNSRQSPKQPTPPLKQLPSPMSVHQNSDQGTFHNQPNQMGMQALPSPSIPPVDHSSNDHYQDPLRHHSQQQSQYQYHHQQQNIHQQHQQSSYQYPAWQPPPMDTQSLSHSQHQPWQQQQPGDMSWQHQSQQPMQEHSFQPHQLPSMNQDQQQYQPTHYPQQQQPQHYSYPSMNYNPHSQYSSYQDTTPQQQYHQMLPPFMPPQQISQHQPISTLPPPNMSQSAQLPTQPTTQLPPASQRLVDCVKKSQEKFDRPPEPKGPKVKQEKTEKPTKGKTAETPAPRGKGTKRKTPAPTENKEAAVSSTPTEESNPKVPKRPPPNRKNHFERKNIRDIIQDEELEATTVAAQKEEQERKRRLQEAQQRALVEKFNQVIQEAEQETAAKAAVKAEAEATAAAIKKEEEEAAVIKAENEATKAALAQQLTVKKENDVILVESSDDDDKRKRNLQMYSREAVKVITVSSSEEESSSSSTDDTSSDDDEDGTGDVKKDDDCVMVLSDDESDEETLSEDPNSSGSHTNDLFNQPDAEGRVVVNVGHPPEEEDIFLAAQLARAVKAHQIGGIRFLYDNVVESITRFPTSSGFGCILAHSMGLGKTIQVISLTDTFLRHTPATTVLCIVPINTIQNWMSEFNMWLPPEGAVPQLLVDSNEIRPRNFNVFLLNENYRTTPARAKVISEWHETGGVMLMGYEMYRMLALKKPAKVAKRRKNRKKEDINPMEVEDDSVDKKLLDDIFLALVNPGPDLVVCDEGHRIKNCSASTSSALKKIHTKRRVVLTGYPLQNNLLEYWCMVDFVRPNYLGSRSEFVNMFERPIQNGQCIDSTPRDIQLMRYRAHVLHSLLEGFVQRRGHAVLRTSLPVKEEHVVLCRMTDVQRELYREFVRDFHSRSNSTNPLLFFAVCCKIWNHPDVLFNFVKNLKSQVVVADNDLDIDLATAATASDKTSLLNKPLVLGLPNKLPEINEHKMNDNSLPVQTSTTPISQALNANQTPINNNNNSNLESPPLNGSSSVNGSPTNINGVPELENKPPVPIPPETSSTPTVKDKPEPVISYEWAKILMETYKTGVIENCHKMAVLFTIIEQSLAVGDKLLVFSQSLLTLDLMERFLNERQIPDRPNIPPGERWSRNFNYCRLDGKTHAQERERLINNFNSNPTMYLFLLSTRAGCLGINLIGANRIVVYDASWNPCHDAQAVCRIYRYGQRKQCFIYRLVTDNCLEKKVYDRQVNKQGMSDRVVDELNPESNFTWKEVSTLVSESEDDGPEQDFSDKAPKYVDHLLQYICTNMSRSLSREPFEHESLLLDRKELKLTKHEKKMAKQSYELEKRGNACGYGRGYTYYSRGGVLQRGAYQGARGAMTFASPTGVQGPRFLPNQSTPVPNQWNRNQKNNSATVLIRAMLHQGVMVRRVTPSNGDSSTVTIPAGQEVLVMRTPKGVYLRVPDGRIIAVRLPQELLNQWQAIGTTTTIGLGGPPTPRPNLLRTHLMTSTTNTSTTSVNSKGNFGTNIVQANLQCGGSVKVAQDGNPEVIDLSDDEEKQRAASNSLLATSGSSIGGSTTMTTTTVSAGAINKMKQMPRIIKVPISPNELKKNPGGQPARIIIRQINRNNTPTTTGVNTGPAQTVTFTRQNTIGGTPSVTITRLPISSAVSNTGTTPTGMTMKPDHVVPGGGNLNKTFSNLTIKRGGPGQPSVTVVRNPGPVNQKNPPVFRTLQSGPQGKVIVKMAPMSNNSNSSNSQDENQQENKIEEVPNLHNKTGSAMATPMTYQASGNVNKSIVNSLNQMKINPNQHNLERKGANESISREGNSNLITGNGPLMKDKTQMSAAMLPGQSILQKMNPETTINPAKIINTYSHTPRRGRGAGARGAKIVNKRNNVKNANGSNDLNEMFMNHSQKPQQDTGGLNRDNQRLNSLGSPTQMSGHLNEPIMSPRGNTQANGGDINTLPNNQQSYVGNGSQIGQSQSSHNTNQAPLGHMDYNQHHHQQHNTQINSGVADSSIHQANNHNPGNNASHSLGGMQSMVDSNQLPMSPATPLGQSAMNQSQPQYMSNFESSPSRQSPPKHLTLLGEPQSTKANNKRSAGKSPLSSEKPNKNLPTPHSSASEASPSPNAPHQNPTFSYANSLPLPSTDPQNMGYSPMDQTNSLRSYGDDPYRQPINDPMGFSHDRSFGMYDQTYYPAPPPPDPLASQNRTDSSYNPYGIPNQAYSTFNPISNSLHFSEQPTHMTNYYDPAGVGGGLNPFGHYSTPHSGFNYNPYGHSSPSASNQHVANHTFLPSYDSFSSSTSPKYGNAPATINNLSPGGSTSSRQSPFPNAPFSSRHSHFLPPSSQQGNTLPTSTSNSQMLPSAQGYGFHQAPYSSSPQPLQNVYSPPMP